MTKSHTYSHYSQNLHSLAHWTVFAHQGWEFSISIRHKIYANQYQNPPVSPRIPVRKKSLYELPFLLTSPTPPPLSVIHLQVFSFSLGESARRKKVFFGRQIGFFFSCEARMFAYRVQILDGCSDRFSQRRMYTRASFLPERGNVSEIRRTLVGTVRLSQDRHYFVWRTWLSREYSRGLGGGKKRGKLEERFLGPNVTREFAII